MSNSPLLQEIFTDSNRVLCRGIRFHPEKPAG